MSINTELNLNDTFQMNISKMSNSKNKKTLINDIK